MLTKWQRWGMAVFAIVMICLLSWLGALRYIWIFPLWESRFSFLVWFLLCLLYIFIPLANIRFFLSAGALFALGILENIWWPAVLLIAAPTLLWWAYEWGKKIGRIIWGSGLVAGIYFAHPKEWTHPGLKNQVYLDWRWLAALVVVSLAFKWIYIGIVRDFRGQKISWDRYVDYWWAPMFWLSPLHGNQLLLRQLEPLSPDDQEETAWGWIWLLRGILHTVLFAWLMREFLSLSWPLAVTQLSPQHFILWGAWLFGINYLEKSRMSYLISGFFRLKGARIAPDFSAPWLARDLYEYWRRFHGWVLEYIEEIFFYPLAAYWNRFFPLWPGLIFFLAFSTATAMSHYVYYSSDAPVTIFLAILFAGTTYLQAKISRFLRKPFLQIPFTILSVFFLYVASYPAFGLGWSWSDYRHWFWGGM